MVLRRWSLRSKLFVILAVVAGAASFTLVRGYAAEIEALRPSTGDPVPVVVAAQALERGTALSDGVLRIERIPSAYAPPGAIGSLARAAGRTLVSDLAEGEPVTETRVAGGGGPVASRVTSGLRAFVVTAGIPSGVLEPGDLVDVIATFGGPRPYTETVGSALEVLSIVEDEAGTFEAAGPSGPSLVLLVDPETAERLAHATAFASIAVTVAPLA
ncbi:MAG: Flp pilus assembly protein CpaB [Actinobacteria bacterium]|nr:Flp pilus assembly protein CpaB [Actinomycetota bacterium]